jgi:hypothetical protein
VISARRSSRSSMANPLARRVFFSKSATPILLLKRISSESRPNEDNSEPTSTMLELTVPLLILFLSRLQCHLRSFLEPLRSLVTFQLPEAVAHGSASIRETGGSLGDFQGPGRFSNYIIALLVQHLRSRILTGKSRYPRSNPVQTS